MNKSKDFAMLMLNRIKQAEPWKVVVSALVAFICIITALNAFAMALTGDMLFKTENTNIDSIRAHGPLVNFFSGFVVLALGAVIIWWLTKPKAIHTQDQYDPLAYKDEDAPLVWREDIRAEALNGPNRLRNVESPTRTDSRSSRYAKVAALAVASTEMYGGSILAIGLVDNRSETIISDYYQADSKGWERCPFDYGMTPKQLSSYAHFEARRSSIQHFLDNQSVILAYDLYHVKKSLEQAGIVFNVPIVNVKSALTDYRGAATLTINFLTRESHRDFDDGTSPLETAKNTMSVFQSLPENVRKEAFEKAQNQFDKSKSTRTYEVAKSL